MCALAMRLRASTAAAIFAACVIAPLSAAGLELKWLPLGDSITVTSLSAIPGEVSPDAVLPFTNGTPSSVGLWQRYPPPCPEWRLRTRRWVVPRPDSPGFGAVEHHGHHRRQSHRRSRECTGRMAAARGAPRLDCGQHPRHFARLDSALTRHRNCAARDECTCATHFFCTRPRPPSPRGMGWKCRRPFCRPHTPLIGTQDCGNVTRGGSADPGFIVESYKKLLDTISAAMPKAHVFAASVLAIRSSIRK